MMRRDTRKANGLIDLARNTPEGWLQRKIWLAAEEAVEELLAPPQEGLTPRGWPSFWNFTKH